MSSWGREEKMGDIDGDILDDSLQGKSTQHVPCKAFRPAVPITRPAFFILR